MLEKVKPNCHLWHLADDPPQGGKDWDSCGKNISQYAARNVRVKMKDGSEMIGWCDCDGDWHVFKGKIPEEAWSGVGSSYTNDVIGWRELK